MLLTPDRLWATVRSQSRRALETGALVPISTSAHVLEDQGLTFAVRRVEKIARKEAAGQTGKKGGRSDEFAGRTEEPPAQSQVDAAQTGDRTGDPFAPPYEPALYVGEVSETHVALLNKFNVLDEHLLLVTREYEPQTALLREADFRAMLWALAGTEGLAFYNGGTDAGASQPHKHLQVVPLPLADSVPRIPFIPLFERAFTSDVSSDGPGGDGNGPGGDGGPGKSPELPFAHAVAPMPDRWRDTPIRSAGEVMELYRELWHSLGYTLTGREQPIPYNLLATTNWLWLVPRRREEYESIAVNALGFAGALLVRDAAMHRRLEKLGPLHVLEGVSKG